MKIRRLAIKNVTSYRERTEFVFDPRLNILIGPNGGGKTNLQKIIALTLSKYFIHQYQFRRDDNAASVDVLDPWAQRRLQQAFPKFVGDGSEQIIEIELVPESRDVANIRAIGGNLEKFNNALSYWEKRYETYDPLRFADGIGQAGSFTFVIQNLALAEPEPQTPAWAFREYLREFFIFQRVVNSIPDVTLSSPVFFFSSDRALSRNFEVQAGQLTDQAYFDGYRSAYNAAMGENMNLMPWATQHFVRLHRRAVNSGASVPDKTWRDFFEQFSDVKLLNRYLEQLGYKWTFFTDNDQLSYLFVLLTKDGKEISANMFSSGEREIVHFLLAMFALNVQDGLILVDEPELHLHPRWQKIFLDLFRELAPERNNQFVITTHSPAFVTPETIDSVTRIYRPSSTGTVQVALRDVHLPAKKSLVRMINSQNNERLFFADKVVLVEGISDRLVLETLLANASARFHISASIEIIEVGGKRNFADYNTILTGLRTETFTVADRDYLTDVGSPEIRTLFVSDSEKQWDILTEGKKSIDRASMISYLNTSIASGNLTELRNFWDYFVNRPKRLKDSLTNAEITLLDAELSRLKRDKVFVLREGEIEDYLPPGGRDIRGIVELVSDRNWINNVSNEKARVELGEIICTIIGVAGRERERFLDELRTASVTFPTPIASAPTTEVATG